MNGSVYLIPTFLHEEARDTLPAYILDCIKKCDAFFVENERTARRFLKSIWREMVIDDYTWFAIHKAEEQVLQQFTALLQQGKHIGIISEAGCPGIADPGQVLVEAAQKIDATVKPLVGPSSILLALMGSGMNGQQFNFNGYLPIDSSERKASIKELETESAQKKCTQIFIETPFRNNALVKELVQTCKPETRLCIAIDLTSSNEFIKTKTIGAWRRELPELHKKLGIFLIYAG